MTYLSYTQRVAKMLKPGDEETQIRLAKNTVKMLRREAKKNIPLAEKIKAQELTKGAERVLRELRANIFNLEDMLKEAQQSATLKN